MHTERSREKSDLGFLFMNLIC